MWERGVCGLSTRMADTPRRSAYHHGDLREALLDAAGAILREAGPEALTLREAARRVGVTHRALYRHFRSKEELLAVMAAKGYAELLAQARAELAAEARRPEDRLLTIARVYLRYAVADPARYALMSGARLNADGRFPELEAQVIEGINLLNAELEATAPGVTGTAIRDAGLTLWAAMHGVADQLNQGRIRVKPERLDGYSRVLLAPVVRGLAETLRGA